MMQSSVEAESKLQVTLGGPVALELATAVVETLRGPSLVLNQELRVVVASRSFLTTFSLTAESIGSRAIDEIDEGRWHGRGLRTLLEGVAANGTPFNDYEIERSLQGHRHAFLVNGRPLVAGNGGPTLILVALEDVTDRRRAEADRATAMARLHQSNRDLEEFAYVASHDLQEPLRMVATYVQLLAEDTKGKLSPSGEECVHFAVDGATRMQRLVQDLLQYARVATEPPASDTVDLEEALAEAVINLRGAIDDSHAIVTHEALPRVRASRRHVIQVLQNLIGNAIKFRGTRSPVVHVLANPHGRFWEVSVADNGIGIDPEHRRRLFRLFQRLNTREKYPGTGLGLALCRRIVQHYGGEIGVDSVPGTGSTFHFTLPALKPEHQ